MNSSIKPRLPPEDIGEYTGDRKEIRPITVTTYQILTYRKRKSEDFVHLGLFSEMDWGLIIYDEVHLLPAPVFRMTAEIQGKRRLRIDRNARARRRQRGRCLQLDWSKKNMMSLGENWKRRGGSLPLNAPKSVLTCPNTYG